MRILVALSNPNCYYLNVRKYHGQGPKVEQVIFYLSSWLSQDKPAYSSNCSLKLDVFHAFQAPPKDGFLSY